MALCTLMVAVATVSVDVDTNGRVDTNGSYSPHLVSRLTLFFRGVGSHIHTSGQVKSV